MNIKLANIIGTYFGLGLSKFAPGTVGSLGSLPLAYLLIKLGGVSALVVGAIVIFFIGVKAVDVITKESGVEDPSKVVIDETVGQLLTFSLIAYLAPEYLDGSSGYLYYLYGFAFFRFFDIVKLGPVKYADKEIKNAYGVMLDDVFAGLFAGVILFLIAWMIC